MMHAEMAGNTHSIRVLFNIHYSVNIEFVLTASALDATQQN